MTNILRLVGGLFLLLAPIAAETVPSVLLLDQAIEIALNRHGDVEAAQAAIASFGGAVRQAGYSPNPTLFLQTENWRFTGTPGFSAGRDLDVFAYISQPIETGGKKQSRVRFAEADEQIAQTQRKAVEWRIRQDVKSSYVRVLAAQQKEELLAATRDTFGRLREYHQVRVNLGAMPEIDLIKVELEVEKIEMDLAAAAIETEQAKIEVLRAMGVPDPSARFAARDTLTAAVAADWQDESLRQDLVNRAVAHRSEVLLAEAFVERARAAVNVQRAAATPDVTPYFGYKRASSFNTLIGGVSIPLPVRDRNTGAIDQAVANVRRQEAALRAARARIGAEVAASLAGVRRRARMLDSMEKRMLRRAESTSRITLAAYQEGGMDLLEVLDAQRSENEIHLLHAQVFRDYQLSQIDLETAVGTESLPISRNWNRAAY